MGISIKEKFAFDKKTLICCIIAVIIIVSRFYSIQFLHNIFTDEDAALKHIEALLENGTDFSGHPWPLYASGGGNGFFTYEFLYPMAAVCFFLGTKPFVARCILQAVTVVACYLTSRGVQIWTGDKKSFWYTFFISLTLPWGFVQANRIWDPAFVPLYFSIFFYFACKFMRSDKKSLRIIKKRVLEGSLFGSLVLLAVIYPPCRIPAVAMWIYMLVWAVKEKKIVKEDIALIFIISSFLSLPLAYHIAFVPGFNTRTASLFTFRGDNLIAETWYFIRNFLENVFPTYMFLTGDIIDRHSLPYLGVLGTINIVAVVAWLRKKWDKMDCFLLYTIMFTFISVALTNEYQPHTLRSCLAWMPFAIMIANGWEYFLRNKGKLFKVLTYAAYGAWYVIFYMVYISYYSAG